MNSASVDLIYLDPPYSKNTTYAAPIGSEAAGAFFKDTWTLSDVDLAWHGEIAESHPALYAIIDSAGLAHGKGMKSYLISMSVRFIEMQRILKSTGTIWLHCDQTAGHYLKILLDCLFGQKNFVAEIAWFIGSRSGAIPKYKPGKSHENLFVYAAKYGKHTYNVQYLPYSDKYLEWFKHTDANGRRYRTRTRKGKIIHQYLDESPGVPLHDTWMDIKHLYTSQGWFPGNREEITGYPTQKPVALLQRIIKASSNPGDIVLDPFCGCATTLVAAEATEREWAGIDLSPLAAKLIAQRLRRRLGAWGEIVHREDVPRRTDLGKLPHYKTHKHTLFGKQEGRCAGCETVFPFRNFTIDHIVPQSKGGHDHIDNLQLLCNACNSQKGSRTQEAFLAGLIAAGLRSRPE